MAFEKLDQEYLYRVSDVDTLSPLSFWPKSVAEAAHVEPPEWIGHSVFLFGYFKSLSELSVQAWAVGSDAPYRTPIGGRHEFAAKELADKHNQADPNLAFTLESVDAPMTNAVCAGYFWQSIGRIVTVVADIDLLQLDGKRCPINADIAANVIRKETEQGNTLMSHDIYFGSDLLIANGVIMSNSQSG